MLQHIIEVTRRVVSELEHLPDVDVRLECGGRLVWATFGDIEAQLISWDHWDPHRMGSSEWWACVVDEETMERDDLINHLYWYSAEEFEALANTFVGRCVDLFDARRRSAN